MKKISVTIALAMGLLFAPSVGFASTSQDIPATRLPDPKITPGLFRTSDPHDTYICGTTKGSRHSTKEIRKLLTQSIKEKVYRQYHLNSHHDGQCNGVKQFCQVDHLGSLELGGDPADLRNLWVQPFEGLWNAHDKDKLENELHKRVCAGTMDLKDVQVRVTTNWIQLYKDVFKVEHPLPIGKGEDTEE